jgi:hypothetical protein
VNHPEDPVPAATSDQAAKAQKTSARLRR